MSQIVLILRLRDSEWEDGDKSGDRICARIISIQGSLVLFFWEDTHNLNISTTVSLAITQSSNSYCSSRSDASSIAIPKSSDG
jgi:hypothetical protein